MGLIRENAFREMLSRKVVAINDGKKYKRDDWGGGSRNDYVALMSGQEMVEWTSQIFKLETF